MKRLLRNKANHAVLEGLLYSLLGKKMTIQRCLSAADDDPDCSLYWTAWEG